MVRELGLEPLYADEGQLSAQGVRAERRSRILCRALLSSWMRLSPTLRNKIQVDKRKTEFNNTLTFVYTEDIQDNQTHPPPLPPHVHRHHIKSHLQEKTKEDVG